MFIREAFATSTKCGGGNSGTASAKQKTMVTGKATIIGNLKNSTLSVKNQKVKPPKTTKARKATILGNM